MQEVTSTNVSMMAGTDMFSSQKVFTLTKLNPLFFMAPILDLKKNPGYQMFKQILESCISDNDDMIDEGENKLIDTLIES